MVNLDIELGTLFAETILELLSNSGYCSGDITAIGSHGQTIRHHCANSRRHFSLQIGDPNTIALLTGITTVADFRRMDIAAGGQGAPLVPAFHDAIFRDENETRVIANIGGMSNITVLAAGSLVTGFDTGPGNVLMDAWIQKNLHKEWDQDGAWAAQGCTDNQLLAQWLAHPFFSQPAPKSTGRETFNLGWMTSHLTPEHEKHPENIQRTLLELTAITLTDEIRSLPASTINRVILCGGGCHNTLLRQRIAELLPESCICDSSNLGIDPDWVEAMAFAWLAKCRIENKTGNLVSVTGAQIACILGGIYEPPLARCNQHSN